MAERPTLPTHSSKALAEALEPASITDAAVAIDAGRDVERDALLTAHHGFALPSLMVTPLQYQAGVVARERGVLAFDRLERYVIAAPEGWRHPEVDPSVWHVERGPQRLRAHGLWPFRQDAPMADFEGSARPRWWSHGLVHALVGFAWWPDLTEWELMHVARLGEAMASLHWYWLGELGRAYCPRHTIHDGGVTPHCHDCRVLEAEARDPAVRAERIRSERGRRIAENALEVLRFEVSCFRTGLHTGQLVVPRGNYLEMGEACDYARVHHRRLVSDATRRWLDHGPVAGRDYATSPNDFEARCAEVLASLLTPMEPSPSDRVAAARGRRVLLDVGQRLCQAAALRGEARGWEGSLRAIADGAERLLDAGPEVHADGVVAEILGRVAADLGDAGDAPRGSAILALGYRPTLDAEAEPEGSRRARIEAVSRRVRAARSPLATTVEALPAGVSRLVEWPRSSDLAQELLQATRRAAAEGAVSQDAAGFVGWLAVAAAEWGVEDSSLELADRWYYRLGMRGLPDEAWWDAYRVVPNPYLVELPSPYDPDWLEEHLAEGADLEPAFVTKPRFVLAGPGRAVPVLLPLTDARRRLLDRISDGPRVRDLLGRGFAADELDRALREELVLCLGMENPVGRFDPPVD